MPTRKAYQYFWVECSNCHARGPRSHDQAPIDKLWNARHDADPVHRLVPVKP